MEKCHPTSAQQRWKVQGGEAIGPWRGRPSGALGRHRSAIALVLGLGIGGFAVFDAAITGLGPAPLIATGAAIAGAALGAIISSYELLVRTETGSALWLRVESFRRFLENSEARHVEEAAEKGVLRHYTAWAVALGETRAWTRASTLVLWIPLFTFFLSLM